MINIIQSKASAGAVNLTSDFDEIAINGIKNLSATLKALIFGFQEDNTGKSAVLQGLRVVIEDKKISISSGVAITASGTYPFFVNKTLEKELTDSEIVGLAQSSKYLVLRPEIIPTDNTIKRLVKTPDGMYEEQAVFYEQSLVYSIEIVDSPLNDDLIFGEIDNELTLQESKGYPVLRLSRTFDSVTSFLDTAAIEAKKDTLMLRDENGRAKITNPLVNEDIANKKYVDDTIAVEAAARTSADTALQNNIDSETKTRAAHEAKKDNPHGVTKSQVGLGNCDNTADSAKNVLSATKLTTARTINGTSFNGTGNITTTNWGTARNISIADSSGTNTGTAESVNGSGAVTLKLPATIKASITGNCSGSSGSCTGNAATATKATQDESGNNIKASYAASLSVSGRTVTLKSKSGAVLSTIITQDTTYDLASTSAVSGNNKAWSMTGTSGLMSGADKAFIEALKKSVTIRSSSESGEYNYYIKFGGSSEYRFLS